MDVGFYNTMKKLGENLFSKYENLQFKPNFNLFDERIDYDLCKKEMKCPWGHKLYLMRSKPLLYCKSKKHKSFIIKNE